MDLLDRVPDLFVEEDELDDDMYVGLKDANSPMVVLKCSNDL